MSVLGGKSFALDKAENVIEIGIIGLDTSHSTTFTEIIHDNTEDPAFAGFKVVAAYPHGSTSIESSKSRIPQYIKEISEMGVEVYDSLDKMIDSVDVVLLETNDGHPRLEQALKVFKAGKPMFIDKPIAANLKDIIAIIEASKRYEVPMFSSSALRYIPNAQAIRNQRLIGDVVGADTYGYAYLEETHPDLFWYGIHGVEMLFTVMGTGCKTVSRVFEEGTDKVVGTWEGGRLGTFRGIREGRGGYGGTVFGTGRVEPLGYRPGFSPLVAKFLEFFRTGLPPVSPEETLEIYAFMEAADESKRRGGEAVSLDYVISQAQ